jgi:SAM-dependent methyltransferase
MLAERADYERARSVAPYANDALVGRQTAALVAAGHRILQIHRLGATDNEHVSVLLEMFAPPPGARVLDAGCGVGRVAVLMREARPDLSFILLNVSAAQLALCPDGFERHRADFHAVPLSDDSVDAAMYLYSLGHGMLSECLAEAARVLRPAGILFVYDLTAADSSRLIVNLGYKAHARADVERAAVVAGFGDARIVEPTETDLSEFHRVVPADQCESLLAGVRPIAYRFVNCAV